MSGLPNALAPVLAGLVAFALVAVAVTAALDPYVWPSALVGLPAGVLAGVAVLVLARRRSKRAGRSGS